MTNPWDEATTLRDGEKEVLARIGAAYLELSEITSRQQALQGDIEVNKTVLRSLRDQLNGTLSKIIKESGLEDGDYSIDYQNRKVVPKNGQVSPSLNG